MSVDIERHMPEPEHMPETEVVQSPNQWQRCAAWVGKRALIGVAAAGILTGSIHQEAATDPPPYTPERISEIEASYATIPDALRLPPGQDYAERIEDEAASTESTIVYRHEGLPELSFARPSTETVQKITEASTIGELEKGAAPFFESLGLRLFMVDAQQQPDAGKSITVLNDSQVPEAREALLHTLNEVALTPREVIEFADISDVVLGSDIHWHNPEGKERHALGMAYLSNAQSGTIAINAINADSRETWNHELGHQVSKSLARTDKRYVNSFVSINPGWFHYTRPEETTMSEEETAVFRERAVAEHVTQREYGSEALLEDQADVYRSFYYDEMTPDPSDASFGTPLGKKRALKMESLNTQVPGVKNYFIGMATASVYSYEDVLAPSSKG